MTLRRPQRYDHTNAQHHGSNNKNFNTVIPKCYNKNACGSKITVRAGDWKQEVYNWWPNAYINFVYNRPGLTDRIVAKNNQLHATETSNPKYTDMHFFNFAICFLCNRLH